MVKFIAETDGIVSILFSFSYSSLMSYFSLDSERNHDFIQETPLSLLSAFRISFF